MDSEQKGGLLIWNMWSKGTSCILDMRVVNMDMASYVLKTSEKILIIAEQGGNVSTFFSFFWSGFWDQIACSLLGGISPILEQQLSSH